MPSQATPRESDDSSVSNQEGQVEFSLRKEIYADGIYEGDFNQIGEREGQGTMLYFFGNINSTGFVRSFARCPSFMAHSLIVIFSSVPSVTSTQGSGRPT